MYLIESKVEKVQQIIKSHLSRMKDFRKMPNFVDSIKNEEKTFFSHFWSSSEHKNLSPLSSFWTLCLYVQLKSLLNSHFPLSLSPLTYWDPLLFDFFPLSLSFAQPSLFFYLSFPLLSFSLPITVSFPLYLYRLCSFLFDFFLPHSSFFYLSSPLSSSL